MSDDALRIFPNGKWKTDRKPFTNLGITDRYLFVQVPKTGSSSFLKALNNAQIIKNSSVRAYRHEGLEYLSSQLSSKLEYIAMARNPFSHALSFYFHQICHNERNDIIEPEESYSYYKKNFKKWLFDNRTKEDVHLKQIGYMTINGEYAIDCLYPFEMGMKKIFQSMNKKYNSSLKENHQNENSLKEYYTRAKEELEAFYDDESINFVTKERYMEFFTFGYSSDILYWKELPKKNNERN